MITIWAELPGNRADSADDGSPTLEHIIVRGESPHSLDFFLTWTMWALRDTWSYDHHRGGDALKSSRQCRFRLSDPRTYHCSRGKARMRWRFFYMDHVGPKGHMVT